MGELSDCGSMTSDSSSRAWHATWSHYHDRVNSRFQLCSCSFAGCPVCVQMRFTPEASLMFGFSFSFLTAWGARILGRNADRKEDTGQRREKRGQRKEKKEIGWGKRKRGERRAEWRERRGRKRREDTERTGERHRKAEERGHWRKEKGERRKARGDRKEERGARKLVRGLVRGEMPDKCQKEK